MLYIDPAYLVGVLDADGSFTICRNGGRNGYSNIRMVVQLSWRDTPDTRPVMEAIVNKYGGRLHVVHREHCNKRLHWYLEGAQIPPLVEDILPHLQIKYRQAELLVRCWRIGRPPNGKRWRKIPRELAEQREKLLEVVQKLNKEN